MMQQLLAAMFAQPCPYCGALIVPGQMVRVNRRQWMHSECATAAAGYVPELKETVTT